MVKIQTLSVKQRLSAIVASGALVLATAAAPYTAFAVDATAGDSHSGPTDVTIQFANGTDEVSDPTTDPNNPDGENISFTVPSSINFVAKADGTLKGPEADKTYIENLSAFSIRVSSVQVTQEEDWNIVSSVQGYSDANVVDFTFGPEGSLLNASECLGKKRGVNANDPKWAMAAKSLDTPNANKVLLKTEGHISNVNKDISEKTKIATIRTYVKPAAVDQTSSQG